MCDPTTAIIVATAVSAGASIYQGNQAAKIDKMNRERAIREAEITNAQLEEERRINAVNAKLAEEDRRKAYERNLSSVRAYKRGLESKSFNAFLSAEEDAFRLDVENLRMSSRIGDSRLATQISVNTSKSALPDLSGYYKTSGYLNAASSIAQGSANYYAVQTPGNNPSSPTTTTTSAYHSSSPSSKGTVSTPNNSGYTYTG